MGQINFLTAVFIFQDHAGVKRHPWKQLILMTDAAWIGSAAFTCESGITFDNIVISIQHNQAVFPVKTGQQPKYIVMD